MPMFNVHQAKSKLSQLLMQAERGEDVVISRNGTPVARLVLCRDQPAAQPGSWRSLPGWETFQYDPAALAAMTTDEELADGGWPV